MTPKYWFVNDFGQRLEFDLFDQALEEACEQQGDVTIYLGDTMVAYREAVN